MAEPTSADTHEAPQPETAGGTIGRFRLLQALGEGGFGTVFEAEQDHPVKRRVALKLIKLGMDTRDVIARFEAERQALALMDHPHIARVLDAGATPSGRPYFVMELVRGEPIVAYCERHRLPLRERLALFQQVCHAVQHAHTKGVIHRDLKPSNVLVSTHEDKPFAKVIDFGIAKATSGRLTDKTLFTAQHQMIGTPLYMSPEQAEGSADVDTRSDIYSLGAVLYELMTGVTPFDLRGLDSSEAQRTIREVEPQRPSARLTRDRRMQRTVRGELDWIAMKALEKDRARRYETANGFALDVQRYLSGERVVAAPPSVSYRVSKFVRRHRIVVAATAMVVGALALGVAGFASQARVARQRALELEQVAKFQAEMLAQVDPTAAGVLLTEDVRQRLARALDSTDVVAADRDATLAAFDADWSKVGATDAARDLIDRTILKPAVEAIDRQFADQPAVDATLRQALADRYAGVGLYDAARPLQDRALATRRRVLGDDDPRTLESLSGMGALLYELGDLDAAEPLLREALARHRAVLGERDQRTLEAIVNLGALLRARGRLAEAEPFYREGLEKERRVLGETHPLTLISLNNVARLLQEQGRPTEAEPYYRDAVAAAKRGLGAEHPTTLAFLNNYGALLLDEGKLGDAEPVLRQALEGNRRVQGAEHFDTLLSTGYLGALLVARGRHADAAALLTPALPAARRTFTGANATRVARMLASLGAAHEALGDTAAAKEELAEAQAIFESSARKQ